MLLKVRERPLAGLAFAAVLVAVALLLRIVTPVSLTYVTFYPAVVLATLAGGWILGVLATIVATASAAYFFVQPVGSFAIGGTDVWNAGAFWVVCTVMIVITDLLIDVLISAHDKAERLAALNRRLAASEKQQHVLMRELSHRMKNQYAVILAMARATGQGIESVPEFQSAFAERLHAMSRAHDLLTRSGWEAVSLTELIGAELEAFSGHGRLELNGPDVRLQEQAVVNVGMALHELATNAAKYGAWSSGNGLVRVSWRLAGDAFELTWQESGGPPAKADGPHGFGRVMLEKIVPSALQGNVRLALEPEGMHWQLSLPASAVETGPAGA